MDETRAALDLITADPEFLRDAADMAASRVRLPRWTEWARSELGHYMTTADLNRVDWRQLRTDVRAAPVA
ncbi:hypothetical protein ABZ351_20175 [Streptomyces microflavus]|uniref:hypothetical protein n=1 Tax=Streptomyces microflavus TaxID=1919 RepID=UPI0033DDE9A1